MPKLRTLSFENVELRAADNRSALAVHRLDLNGGMICGLVGLNRSGRSTLLRYVGGGFLPRLEHRPDVRVLVEFEAGQPLSFDPLRHSAYLGPDAHAGLSTLTSRVADEIRLHRALDPSPPGTEAEDLADEAAEGLGLRGLDDRDPLGLSGGQAAALGLVCAIAMGRPVLCVDQSLEQLDIRRRAAAWGYLRRFAALGRLVMISENDYGLMAEHADRLILMDDGVASDGGDGPGSLVSARARTQGTVPPVSALAALLGFDPEALPVHYGPFLAAIRLLVSRGAIAEEEVTHAGDRP